jgi:hypothetical protein
VALVAAAISDPLRWLGSVRSSEHWPSPKGLRGSLINAR